MTEEELREKCGLRKGQLIESNLGLIDILEVRDNTAILGVLANGKIIRESVESVIEKLTILNKGV